VSLRDLRSRVSALAARVPTAMRTPRLCVVTSDEPADMRAARIAEAERAGDPILEVTLFDHNETEGNTTT
jgi:hypothetical protein